MNKDFRDLLVKYGNGNCTPEEAEKVNEWYDMIEDASLQPDVNEIPLIRKRMLENIKKGLSEVRTPLGKRRYLSAHTLLKVAAAVLILMASDFWFLTDSNFMPDSGRISQQSVKNVFENETSGVKVYALADGSTVKLEPCAKIQFQDFSADKREVYLTGKAYFDIEKHPSRPFYVYTGTVATRVLGTSFIIDAPANSSKVEVSVITGKVSVFEVKNVPSKKEKGSAGKIPDSNGVVLSPNQKVEYFIEDGHWVMGLVEDPVPVKSIDQEKFSFVFASTPVKEVLSDINERFGIEVVTENEKICECTFTGDVSKMTLYDILDVISNSIGSTYEVKGTRILVSGKGCH